MDKNTLTGLLLMAAVVFLFMWLNKPAPQDAATAPATGQTATDNYAATTVQPLTEAEIARIVPTVTTYGTAEAAGVYTLKNSSMNLSYNATADSASRLSGTVSVGTTDIDINRLISGDVASLAPEQVLMAQKTLRDNISDINKYKSFARFLGGENRKTVVENDRMAVTFASKGGMIEKVVLKEYKTETTEKPTDICLFDASAASYNFTFNTSDQRINTANLNFQTLQPNDSTVVMSLPLADGVAWQIKYTVVPELYLVKMDIVQNGVNAVIPPSTTTMNFDWRLKMARNEKGKTFEERNSCIYYKMLGDSPDDLDANGDEAEKLTGHVKWVAFKNQFFSSVIIPRKHFSSAELNSAVIKDSGYLKDMSMAAVLPYSTADGSPAAFDFYFGPNDYPMLCDLDDALSSDGEDLDLNRLVPLGWGIFRWINQLIVIPVFSFLSKFISNYGIIILLLTIFIKIILFPFTYKSYKSQARMRVLAPEIKEINEKFPGDENAMKRQQETMALYSRVGASPFSGCLPMLLQWPVLIAMFSFFPSAIELRGESFLWVHDLSAPDTICTLPFSIPFYGNHVSLFCLLMTVVNIIYMRITMQSQPQQSSMPGMKWMMYLMPVMFLFFFNDYAAGLSYYYFLSLLITIVQTWIFRRFTDDEKVRQELLENAKKPRKKTGFLARLEEAQKKQEAYMRQQAKEQARRNRR